MAHFKFEPCGNCCGCTYLDDEFERFELGGGYELQSGSVQLNYSTLFLAPGTKVLCHASQPLGEANFSLDLRHLSVTVDGPNYLDVLVDGGRFVLRVGMWNNATNNLGTLQLLDDSGTVLKSCDMAAGNLTNSPLFRLVDGWLFHSEFTWHNQFGHYVGPITDTQIVIESHASNPGNFGIGRLLLARVDGDYPTCPVLVRSNVIHTTESYYGSFASLDAHWQLWELDDPANWTVAGGKLSTAVIGATATPRYEHDNLPTDNWMLTLQGAQGWRLRFPPLAYYLDVVQDTWDTAVATLYDAAGGPIRSVSIWNNTNAGPRPWLSFDDQHRLVYGDVILSPPQVAKPAKYVLEARPQNGATIAIPAYHWVERVFAAGGDCLADDLHCRTFPAEYHQLPRFAEYTLAGVTNALDPSDLGYCDNASALNTTYILSQVGRELKCSVFRPYHPNVTCRLPIQARLSYLAVSGGLQFTLSMWGSDGAYSYAYNPVWKSAVLPAPLDFTMFDGLTLTFEADYGSLYLQPGVSIYTNWPATITITRPQW